MSLRSHGSSQRRPTAYETHKASREVTCDISESCLTDSNASVQSVKDREFLQTKLEAMIMRGEIEMDHSFSPMPISISNTPGKQSQI